jgi:hypothetical protein
VDLEADESFNIFSSVEMLPIEIAPRDSRDTPAGTGGFLNVLTTLTGGVDGRAGRRSSENSSSSIRHVSVYLTSISSTAPVEPAMVCAELTDLLTGGFDPFDSNQGI